tara:strand:- start:134 stop:292 length:159 start_codon:yes stop_codon:yes gene_type:complete
LASVGQQSRDNDYYPDPEEVERRKKERGKQRFMDDFDFVNQDFFNMWKQRTQ